MLEAISRSNFPTLSFISPAFLRRSSAASEIFWALLKRGIGGTYVSVEPFHLFRYLDEQSFRYNNRKDMNDAGRFILALSQITDKRLTYKSLTGKDREYEPIPPTVY
jgi:hypothetical protein